MGYFYFDESIHDRAGFIIGAFVFAKSDLTPVVLDAIEQVGLRPGVDEFKSSAKMSENQEQQRLRRRIATILFDHCKIAVLVLPRDQRNDLGRYALSCLTKIIEANGLSAARHDAYFDEGIDLSGPAPDVPYNIYANQRSEVCAGIQVADYAAHTLGTMLLEQRGLIRKVLSVGEGAGYEPGTRIELGFELWARIRYNFFVGPPRSPPDSNDLIAEMTYEVSGYGLYIADSCGAALAEAATERFGECYLGCIH